MELKKINFLQNFRCITSCRVFASVFRVFLAVLGVLFIASCSGSKNDPVPVPPSSITVSSGALSFGEVPLNVEKKMSVTVTNTSAVTAIGLNIGVLSGEFTRTTTCDSSLNVGSSCNVEVTFRPTVNGDKAASLAVTSVNGGNVNVSLTGKGVPAAAVISVNKSNLSFDDVTVNTSKKLSVKVSNIGNITAIGLDIGTLSGDFIRTTTCGNSLDIGANCDIEVTFAPISEGDKAASLAVTSVNGGNADVSLTGKGIPAYVAVITVDKTKLLFDDVTVNTSKKLSVKVSNTGTATANGLDIGVLSGEFTRTTTCGNSLDIGANCDIEVTFAPISEGDKAASLAVTSVNGGNVNVSLMGKGIPAYVAVITVDKTKLLFDDVTVNTSKKLSVKVSNTGTATANGLDIGVLSGEFTRTTTCGNSLDIGANCDVEVTFAPISEGDKAASLAVTSVNGGNVTVSLTGKGIPAYVAVITVDKTKLLFDDVTVNTSKKLSVKVSNTGMAAANGLDIGVLSGEFTRTTTCGTSLDIGANCDIEVTFAPISEGDKAASLAVTSVNGGNVNVSLMGKGIPAYIAVITVDKTKLLFDDVTVNTSKKLSVKVSNTGMAAANGLDIGVLSGEFTRTTTCGTSLDIGANCDVEVTFAPISEGDKAASLAVTSVNGGNVNVSLTGKGVTVGVAVITVDRNNLEFDNVPVGGSKTLSVKVSNTGNAQAMDLTIANLSGAFSRTSTCVPTLDAGADCNIDVKYTRSEENDIRVTLRITSVNGGTNDIILTSIAVPVVMTKIYSSHSRRFPYFSFGLSGDNKLYAWGSNDLGQLGVDDRVSRNRPAEVKVPEGINFTDMYIGAYYVIAKGSDGIFYAWGSNTYGQLGVGNTNIINKPTPVVMPAGVTFANVYISDYSTIAEGSNGKLYAWGYNAQGQLGLGNNDNTNEPTEVPYPIGVTSFRHIYTDFSYTLAEGDDDNFYAWGDNTYGQLGTNDKISRNKPTKVDYPSGVTKYTKVFVGFYHAGAIGDNNNLYMWGQNTYGQLGVGDKVDKLVATSVIMPPLVTFADIVLGIEHTSSIGSDGKLYSWGMNEHGQLGIGSADNNIVQPTTNASDTKTYSNLYPNQTYCFAKGTDNQFYGWGSNDLGQLGIFNRTNQNSPVLLLIPDGVASYSDINLGGNFTFAKGNNGKYYGWGANNDGQLGLGDLDTRYVPTELK